uniref:Uncharacterized protein n=1 Tax=Cannabis sativa TaxID=3483 RepID=A0A803PS55_CANSA
MKAKFAALAVKRRKEQKEQKEKPPAESSASNPGRFFGEVFKDSGVILRLPTKAKLIKEGGEVVVDQKTKAQNLSLLLKHPKQIIDVPAATTKLTPTLGSAMGAFAADLMYQFRSTLAEDVLLAHRATDAVARMTLELETIQMEDNATISQREQSLRSAILLKRSKTQPK